MTSTPCEAAGRGGSGSRERLAVSGGLAEVLLHLDLDRHQVHAGRRRELAAHAPREVLRQHLDRRVRDRQQCADRKSTRLNSSHLVISYAVFCLKKKT